MHAEVPGPLSPRPGGEEVGKIFRGESSHWGQCSQKGGVKLRGGTWHWAPGFLPQSYMNLLQNDFLSLSKCLSFCSGHQISYLDDWGLGPLTYTLKKNVCACIPHKSISECTCHFWILRLPLIFPLWNNVNIFSNQKSLSLSVSCKWVDLFWFIISLSVDFIPVLGNENSFKIAGAGPFHS